MAEIITLPEFVTRDPWKGPPATPFEWRVINMGPVDFEFLFDARGRQIFQRSSAVIRKAGTTDIIWPERDLDEDGGAHD